MQRLEFAYWFLVLLWSSVSSLCSLSFLLEWASSNEGRNCIVRLPGEQGQAAELCVMQCLLSPEEDNRSPGTREEQL
ncbi:hypothetical protein LEMLEM_LOCUS11227 [Lemmus lemmus]